jgi:medium-chain acyl-[acyl-carrier-protein] hydrolase
MTGFVGPSADIGMENLLERVAALSSQKQAELWRRLRRAGPAPDRWIVRHRPDDPGTDVRLFCFSYAGGGASVFRTWADALPEVDVCAVQLPGRESRRNEPAYRRIAPLVTTLAEAIAPYLDRPFTFFGHSMGALVAFELARYLRRGSKPLPVRLSVAAYRAPQLPSPNTRIYHQPDEVLKVVLRTYGTPQTVLQNEDLMRMILPTLRADFELCDTYEYLPEAPLTCPLSIFGGLEDVRVSSADLEGWLVQTNTGYRLSMLPGSHFFVHSAHDLLLAEIRHDLARDGLLREEESRV